MKIFVGLLLIVRSLCYFSFAVVGFLKQITKSIRKVLASLRFDRFLKKGFMLDFYVSLQHTVTVRYTCLVTRKR